MANANLTEFALRKAVLGFDSRKPIKTIEEETVSHAQVLVRGQLSASEQLGEISLQKEAIGLAITAIAFSYMAISDQISRLGRKRLQFDKERRARVATFSIPVNKIVNTLKPEQKTINEYLKLIEENKRLMMFLGLKVDKVNEDDIKKESTFISCVPYYLMSSQLPVSYVSQSPSDKLNRQLALFFRTNIPEILEEINIDFDHSCKLVDFFDSWFSGDNFLNDLRGRRLIIISLANLLWNLQHPIDINTGFALSLDEKISLCKEVLVFLNVLLDSRQEPDLRRLDEKNNLLSFVQTVEIYVSEQLKAFTKEKIEKLNIEDIGNKAHLAARILNNNIFKLIYGRDDVAVELASNIGLIRLLLGRNDYVLSLIEHTKFKHVLLNCPPKTTGDLLIIFSNISAKKQKGIIKKLKEYPSSSAETLAVALTQYRNDFLKPIYRHFKDKGATKEEKKIPHWLTRKAANHILPLIGLAIEDYRVDVCLQGEKSLKLQHEKQDAVFHTGKEQFEAITATAYQNELLVKNKHKKPFDFIWSISSYLDMDKSIETLLDELPLRQYKIGELTELLDLIQGFINQYRSFLQYKPFKTFILQTLRDIGEAFHDLKELIASLDLKINSDTTRDRSLISTIQNMDKDLSSEVRRFADLIEAAEENLNAPEFEEGVRQEIASRLEKIEVQYSKAFPERKGQTMSLMNTLHIEPKAKRLIHQASQASLTRNDHKHTLHINQLISSCYHALSKASQKGVKGELLLVLQRRILAKGTLNDSEAKAVLLELVRITFSYRPWLFHANYAVTRSAKTLKKILLDSISQQDYPYLSVLLGEDTTKNIASSKNPYYTLEQNLLTLRKDRDWAVSSSFLKEVACLEI